MHSFAMTKNEQLINGILLGFFFNVGLYAYRRSFKFFAFNTFLTLPCLYYVGASWIYVEIVKEMAKSE